MKPYDSSYQPPAPSLVVNVSALGGEGEDSVDVAMKLDSGADMSCLPQWVVEQVGSRAYSVVEVVGYARDVVRRRSRRLRLEFDGMWFEVSVLPMDGQAGLLGRDVLNRLYLNLDGPELSWSVRNA